MPENQIFSSSTTALEVSGSMELAESLEQPVQTAVGTYTLAVERDAAGEDILYISGMQNRVYGNGSTADKATFRQNISQVWSGEVISSQFADNIYNSVVSASPTITASGAVGEFNRSVYESLLARDMPIGDSAGYSDSGVAELYAGSSQYGPNAAAMSSLNSFTSVMTDRLGRGGPEEVEVYGRASSGNSNSAYAYIGGDSAYGKRTWIGGYGLRENMEAKDGFAGYEYDAYGVALGSDHAIGSVTLGAAATFSRGDYKDKAASANDSTIDSLAVGGYVSYRNGSGYFATVNGAYSRFDADMNDVRGGLARHANYGGDAWTVGAFVGKDVEVTDRITVTPSLGLTRIKATSDSHEEFYNGMDVMRVGEVSRRSTTIPVEARVEYELLPYSENSLTLSATLGYSYELDGDGVFGDVLHHGLTSVGGVPISSRSADRHRVNLGLGIAYST
ncbi:MAG: autotransporter outer membrane beta-barrel domain-containing protein, partial [Planctomycetes bacterium]|nr:autotransporter outer membrane beta-barrel domain-containing protein [Planctomycetota bacterium]